MSGVSENTSLLHHGRRSSLSRVVSNGAISSHGTSDEEQDDIFRQDPNFNTTWTTESKLLAKYSAPLIVTYLIQYAYNLVTVFVAGRLGKNELAAASLASLMANITGLCVYEGLATSLDTMASQAFGAGKPKLVGIHVQRMIALILVATVPIGALWICSPWILATFIPEKELAHLAGRFMRVYLIGAPGYGVFEAGKRFCQAQGDFYASLIPVLICAPLNIFWNWLFVFRLNLGFEGAALAIAVSFTLQPIILLIYINCFARWTLQCWPGFELKSCFQNWGPMIKLAVPGVLMILPEWLAFDILTIASSYISADSLAANSVLTTVAVTMYHIPMPVAVAGSTRFGNLIGYGALNAARTAFKVYYVVFVGIGLFDIALIFSLRHVIAMLFTDDQGVRGLIIQTMPVVVVLQMFDALTALASALLRGLGLQKIGGPINLGVHYLFSVPLSLFLTFGPAKMGLIGLWIGPSMGLALAAITMSGYMWWYDWDRAVEDARSREE